MPHHLRSVAIAASLLASLGLAACGSSGSDAGSEGSTAPQETTTTVAITTTTADGTTTTTEPVVVDGEVDCDALLLEYAEVFDPDDLSATVEFFRRYEPSMPADVAAATERLAVAYEEAGDLGHIDLADVDLTADAQAFSDWTNDGCPPG